MLYQDVSLWNVIDSVSSIKKKTLVLGVTLNDLRIPRTILNNQLFCIPIPKPLINTYPENSLHQTTKINSTHQNKKIQNTKCKHFKFEINVGIVRITHNMLIDAMNLMLEAHTDKLLHTSASNSQMAGSRELHCCQFS